MEGADPDIARGSAHHGLQSRFHFAGRFVREGYGENAIGSDAFLFKQVGDAVRQDPRFSASGAREDQNRTIALPNGGRLHVVEDFRFQEHL
jgi:hypothetical protein